MAVVGSLSVLLKANTSGLTKGLNKGKKSVSRFATSIASITKKVAAFGLVTAGAAAVGIAALTKKSLKNIDATAKLADTLGLAVESLQALNLASELAGVGQGELNSSLRRFQKSVSDASVGLSTAIRAFEDLGISQQELIKLSPEAAFEKSVNALAKMENQFQRARVAQDLFGRSGLKVIKLADQGGLSINEFVKELREMGILFDRIDASKVEAANDSFTRLGTLIDGVGNVLAIKFAPFIEAGISALKDMGTTGESAGKRVSNAFESGLRLVAVLADGISIINAAWNTFMGIVNSVSAVVNAAIATILNALRSAARGVGLDGLAGELDSAFRSMKRITELSGMDAKKNFENLSDEVGNIFGGKRSKEASEFFDKMQRDATNAAKAIGRSTPKSFSDGMKEAIGQKSLLQEAEEAGLVGKATPEKQVARAREATSARFQQIDPSRVDVGALSPSQKVKVEDPQLKTTNMLLERNIDILAGLAQGGFNPVAV